MSKLPTRTRPAAPSVPVPSRPSTEDPAPPGQAAPSTFTVAVAVDTPMHAGLSGVLHYLAAKPLLPGTIVRVPLGRRLVSGIVWASSTAPQPQTVLREVQQAWEHLPPLPQAWRELVDFACGYYHRGEGDLALSVLPPELRRLDAAALARRLARLRTAAGVQPGPVRVPAAAVASPAVPALTEEQQAALEGLRSADRPVLLHGVTGSGKTEVYLRAAQRALDQGLQALVLVPEINLTPQLHERFAQRFPDRQVVSLHSGLTPAQRLRHWLAAHLGLADLVLGTRLAVFTPLPRPGLIVVDEEHDASYKQQEGARYSARDLAVVRARLERVPVVLGSATPSLESWHRAQQGRYQRLSMASRVGSASMPQLRLIDMSRLAPAGGGAPPAIAPPLREAIEQRIARGEQSLLLLNRRGYAPVLFCAACGWKSACAHCTAWRVFHKTDRTLACHHCGFTDRVPRACPDCGNLDIAPLGRGTERLQEQMAELLPGARLARIDADTTRAAGALQGQLAAVHAGDVDVLVGTQMLAKGHDFRRVTLVAAVNPDSALFASDFRAPERLFSLLMQAAGRAGRDAAVAQGSQMWLQTWHPAHPLYAALARQDYAAFAAQQLREREASGLPPFVHLALLRAEARERRPALDFLAQAAEAASALQEAPMVRLYPPVPAPMSRVADVERAQMLLESRSRRALQSLLGQWVPALQGIRRAHRGVLRWAVDVDPLGI